MTTTRSSSMRSSPLAFPSDLRAWTDQRTLVNLALLQSAEVGEMLPRPGNIKKANDHCASPMLLALLSYGYACGIYASREIERLTYTDETIRYLAVHSHPSGEDLRIFRRQNRAAIKECLARVLGAVWLNHFAGTAEASDDEGACGLDSQFLGTELGQQMRLEAELRLDQAVQSDGVDGDE